MFVQRIYILCFLLSACACACIVCVCVCGVPGVVPPHIWDRQWLFDRNLRVYAVHACVHVYVCCIMNSEQDSPASMDSAATFDCSH